MRRLTGLLVLVAALFPATATATPGPPSALCGGRIFPEAAKATAHVQYTANPPGFMAHPG